MEYNKCIIRVQQEYNKGMKKLQLTFNQKYNTIHCIGLSDTSEVYLAFDPATQKQYAIKLEPIDAHHPHLQRQAKIYRLLKGGTGFPNLYWYGVENDFRVLVTDVYGPSLQQLMLFCGGKFTLKTVLLVIDQIFDRVEWVHSKNLTYSDICPDNFLVGLREKADKIFMVDFGNCKKFVDQTDTHLELGTAQPDTKCDVRFKSIHGHMGKTQSRRDDLESLGYLMCFMLRGGLPWDKMEEEYPGSLDNQIKQSKVSIPIRVLCEGLPKEFDRYFEYCQSLEFEEEPDYVWIKRLFRDLFDASGFENNRVLDWAEKHKY